MTGRLGTIEIEARLESPPTPVGPLTLQVPWNASVRAHEGSTYEYAQDFDIEVGNDVFLAGPIVANIDTGFGISARRIESRDLFGDLELEIAYSNNRPTFVRIDTTFMGDAPVSIEEARGAMASWRGRVPASPGRYSIKLDDGRTVRLAVHGPCACTAAACSVFRRELPTVGPTADEGPTGQRSLRINLEVAGEERTYDVALIPRDTTVGSSSREGSLIIPIANALAKSAETGTPRWPQPGGGLRIEARTLPAEGVEFIDLVVERVWPADEIRFGGGLPPGADPKAPEWPALSVIPVRTQTVHVDLPHAGEATVSLSGVDSQIGPLRLRLVTGATGR
ncbi:MAG: hypothetical protein KDB73_17250 [Planctomycetes bacterium]|nr:hypothetical protein [Planctomycetota bacterium]